MHLLYCDETNLEERAGDFLIYGGMMIDASRAQQLSTAIDELRARSGVPRDYLLKFNPGPTKFSHSQFIHLKQAALELAAEYGARLLVYLILHDIACDPDAARRNGINTVCYHFNCILNRLDGPGLVLIDRFNDEGNLIEAHLRKKFTVGLTGMPFSKEMRLAHIVGFHNSAMGQSHFPSLVDIALGSLRFAVNAHTRVQPEHQATARALLRLLSPLFWRPLNNESIPDLAFTLSPKAVQVPRFRTKYQALKDFLSENGLLIAQEIAAQQRY